MEIVNELDQDVTWWCFDSDDFAEEVPVKQGDLSKGKRTSYSPPGNATGAYSVRFTHKGGGSTYAPWRPANSSTLARGKIDENGTITLRGSCGYEALVGYPTGRSRLSRMWRAICSMRRSRKCRADGDAEASRRGRPTAATPAPSGPRPGRQLRAGSSSIVRMAPWPGARESTGRLSGPGLASRCFISLCRAPTMPQATVGLRPPA